jgi:ATP-dependent Clp protease ATP-binding subunit ClpB
VKEDVLKVVVKHFSPEFVNRIDETVVFQPLQAGQIRAIAEIQIALLNDRLRERELVLEVSDAALDRLAEVGYDPVYGARPLKRAIQNHIENPLAQEVLKGSFVPGSVINVDANPAGGLKFGSAAVH